MFAALRLSALGALSLSSIYLSMWLSLSLSLSLCVSLLPRLPVSHLAGVPPFPPVIRGMYNDSGAAKRADPTTYRHRSYTVVGDAEADFRVTWTGEGAAQGLDVTPP